MDLASYVAAYSLLMDVLLAQITASPTHLPQWHGDLQIYVQTLDYVRMIHQTLVVVEVHLVVI